MTTESQVFSVRSRGPLAIFTRPEFKAERVSYPVITPSAARGILEAVLWKPAMRWSIHRIKVLNPIRFVNVRRNEVTRKAVAPSAAVIESGGQPPEYYSDEDRAQRNTVALRDVDYVIDAAFEMTSAAGSGDNLNKFTEMFRRRLEKGQHFHQPYLGCRECVADVLPASGDEVPIGESAELGLMLWDIEFRPGGNRSFFFDAALRAGVVAVPTAAAMSREEPVQ